MWFSLDSEPKSIRSFKLDPKYSEIKKMETLLLYLFCSLNIMMSISLGAEDYPLWSWVN